jgi:hypothetical protein
MIIYTWPMNWRLESGSKYRINMAKAVDRVNNYISGHLVYYHNFDYCRYGNHSITINANDHPGLLTFILI